MNRINEFYLNFKILIYKFLIKIIEINEKIKTKRLKTYVNNYIIESSGYNIEVIKNLIINSHKKQ